MGSVWQTQVTGRVLSIEPLEEYYIDDEDAEKVQKAIMLCMSRDKKVAMILVQHYHYRSTTASRLVYRARNKFWRYLC